MSPFSRLFAGLLRLSLGLGAAVLILAGLYVSLGRELMPLVAEYRAEVEARASQALGMPLHIGRLSGRWQGFSPVLVAQDLQLGEGGDQLYLDQVQVFPDVLQSLLKRELRIADLRLQGLKLGLRQQADGQWQVEGLPRRQDAPPLDLPKVLQQSQILARLSLIDSQVTVEPLERAPLSLSYINLSLSNGLSRQRLDGRLLLPDGQPLALSVQTRLQAENWRDSPTQVYLSLPQSDWAQWLPPSLLGAWQASRLQVGGEFWLDWAHGGVQRAVGRVHAPQLVGAHAEQPPVTVQDLAVNLYFQRREQGFEVLLDSLAATLGEQRWGEINLALRQQLIPGSAEPHWSLQADRLDLAPLTPMVEALVPLPEKAREALQALQPRGLIRNLKLELQPSAPLYERVQFAANVSQVGVNAYHGSPALENVSGRIEGTPGAGELRVDSPDFVLHLSNFFPKPWHYQQANALLQWRFDDQAFSLISPYLQVRGEEGQIGGDFMIRLMRDPSRESYMDLRVGLRDSDARYTEKYLPTLSPALSPALSKWLKTAIVNGVLEQGWFQYQGSLRKGAEPHSRAVSLYFKVHDAELAFQPGWPALQQVRGEVFVEPHVVKVLASEGRMLNSQVSDVAVNIPLVPGQELRLAVTGAVQSNVPDALKILQEAPIATTELFAGWHGAGALQGALDLDIPLQAGGKPVHAIVDFATEDGRLHIASPALDLQQIRGAFRYDTQAGLSAPDIRAQLFERAVRGRARAQGRNGKAVTRLDASGQIKLESLTGWLGVAKQPLPLGGEMPYQLGLILDGADSQLTVDSTLKGLRVELPAPFAKAPGEVRDSQWRMSLQGPQRRYWARYGTLASLRMVAPATDLAAGRGELLLGEGAARLPVASGLRVRGQLAELDWPAWQRVIKGYAPSDGGEALQLFKGGQLQIGRVSGFGPPVENLNVTLGRLPSAWQLDLASQPFKGRVTLADAKTVPLQIALEYLKLPASDTSQESMPPAPEVRPDPLAAVDPRQIPAMDVRIAELWLGPQPSGAWAFKARPSTAGVQFSDLNLNLRGLQLRGNLGWEGAPGQTRTWYKGRIQGQDLAQVLEAWGYAPSASSESFHLDVDGRWPNSPAAFGLKHFSGRLDGSLHNGQLREVQGAATALRVFGLLNFNSIGRRLRLDFSDLWGKGLSYDRFKGILNARNGLYRTVEPITLTGPSSNLELNGQLDMRDETIDAKLLVTLPLSNNLPLAALIVGAPAIGGALFVVNKLLGDQVARFASVQYDVQGPLNEPRISFDKPFEKPN